MRVLSDRLQRGDCPGELLVAFSVHAPIDRLCSTKTSNFKSGTLADSHQYGAVHSTLLSSASTSKAHPTDHTGVVTSPIRLV